MSFNDRVMNGERQATWWCGYCFGSGTWTNVPATEAARVAVYEQLQARQDAHHCPRKPHRVTLHRRRVL